MRGAKILVWVGAGKKWVHRFWAACTLEREGFGITTTVLEEICTIESSDYRWRHQKGFEVIGMIIPRNTMKSLLLVTNGIALCQKKTIREKHQSEPIRSPINRGGK